MGLVELLCVVLLAVGLGLRRRAGPLTQWRRDAFGVFFGAWLGEQSCIACYDFYRYDPAWHGWLGHVPVLIPAIWIFVVLSARDVARALAGATASPLPLAFLVIACDAALIEPIATHAGLWRWTQPGPFAVPWIGMLGWALYGGAALAWLEWLPAGRRWLVALLAPLSTHALLLALWWGCLRWVLRDRPADATVALAAWLLALGAVLALWRTRRLGAVPLGLLLPRMPPAVFFFGLLAATRAGAGLVAYALAFAVPWLGMTAWRKDGWISPESAEKPRVSPPPSPATKVVASGSAPAAPAPPAARARPPGAPSPQ